ncbi:hypothetical protein [Methanocella conradii]|uniref:hypothetical protein n=2 Tax=Methanocella conradii TaxID=1175444 RepID=UPI00064E743C|nr:hypothetical protein [Methanocella conradii]
MMTLFRDGLRVIENIKSVMCTLLDRLRNAAGEFWGLTVSFTAKNVARMADVARRAWASLVSGADETLKAATKTLAKINKAIVKSIKIIIRDARKFWGLTVSFTAKNVARMADVARRAWASLVSGADETLKAATKTLAKIKEKMQQFARGIAKVITRGCHQIKAEFSALWALYQSSYNESNDIDEQLDRIIAESERISSDLDDMHKIKPSESNLPVLSPVVAVEGTTRDLMRNNMLGDKIMNNSPQPPITKENAPITPPTLETKVPQDVTKEDVMKDLMRNNMLGDKIMNNSPQPPITKEINPLQDYDPFAEETNIIPDDPFAEETTEIPEPIRMDNDDLLTSLENEAAKVEADDMGLDIMRDMKDRKVTCEELESDLREVIMIFKKTRTASRKKKNKTEKRDVY